MTIAISASDPTIALAELSLYADNVNSDNDEQNMRAARAQEQAAIQQEVQKLHEAAHDMRTGAWVQGLTSLGGTIAVGLGDYGNAERGVTSAKVLKDAGEGANALAGPAANLWGTAPQKDAEADAEAAKARAADAQARAEEAEHHRQRMEQNADRTLSSVDAIVNSEAQGRLALIAKI